MIERQIVEDFVRLMEEHDLVELDVVDGEQRVTLRRKDDSAAAAAPPPPAAAAAPAAPASTGGGVSAGSGGGAAAAEEGTFIRSPMVGTFYSKPNPDADAFVAVGDKVSDASVVCLVEAMKVFNEVKAECRGTILEVLASDGDPVEFNQPLFRIEPS